MDYFDQTDGLQAPYSDDDSELTHENKKSGDDVNYLNKFKRKTHQPQDEENIFNIRLYPSRRKSRHEYQTVDYYETMDDLRAPFDINNLNTGEDNEDNEVEYNSLEK